MSILDQMNFNPYAFVSPSNPTEYMALLDEGLRLIEQINEQMGALLGPESPGE